MPIRTVESVKADLATLDAALEVVRNVRSKEMDSSQARWGDASFDQAYADFGHVYEFLENKLEELRNPFRDAKSLLEQIELDQIPSKTSYLLYDRGALLVQYVRFLEGRVAELADKMESYRP